MKLRKGETQESFVRPPEEEERKKIPWGKYIYLLILAGALLAVGPCIYRRVVYSAGTGVLRGTVMVVGAPRTGRIDTLKVRQGDEVEARQVVARMHLPELSMDVARRKEELKRELRRVETRIGRMRRELKLAKKKKTNQTAVVEELARKRKRVDKLTSNDAGDGLQVGLSEESFNTLQELWVARQRKKNARDRVERLNEELSRAEKLFKKGVVTGEKTRTLETKLSEARRTLDLWKMKQQVARAAVRSSGERIRERLAEARRRRSVLETTVSNLQKALENARKQRKKLRRQMKGDRELQQSLADQKILRAPSGGIVTRLGKREGEVVRAGEPVMRIEKRKDLHLKTYFALSDAPAVKRGRQVRVVFPSGKSMTGRIREVAPATASFSAEKMQNIRLQEPRIVAEVVPVDGSLERRVLGTEVKVYLSRRWWSWFVWW